MHVSSDHVSHHAPAIERSQSDRISNVFVSQPRLASHRMYTATPWHTTERSFSFESMNRWTGGSLCTACARQSKAGRRKHSKFDRSGTVRWPEHGSIVQGLRNILICCVANLEHGCWIVSEDKIVY